MIKTKKGPDGILVIPNVRHYRKIRRFWRAIVVTDGNDAAVVDIVLRPVAGTKEDTKRIVRRILPNYGRVSAVNREVQQNEIAFKNGSTIKFPSDSVGPFEGMNPANIWHG
jgi:hypothetical protein